MKKALRAGQYRVIVDNDACTRAIRPNQTRVNSTGPRDDPIRRSTGLQILILASTALRRYGKLSVFLKRTLVG